MTPFTRSAAVPLLLLAACAGADTQPAPVLPPHLRAALEIAAAIKPVDNEYAHKECFIRWKGVDGADRFANRTDCSDFLNLLTEHVYNFRPATFKAWTGVDRPTAAAWFDAVANGSAKDLLTPLQTVAAALPGDLILIKYPPGEGDTGHVMILAGAPAQRPASAPLQPNTTQWEIPVVDSSKSGHGTTDTRHQPDGSFAQGVGKGVFRLYTNPDNSLAGYSWSTQKVSKFVPVSEHAVRLAHLLPPTPSP